MASSDDESVASSVDSATFDDISKPEIVTKYRLAGDFANYALEAVIEACVPGAKVLDLCKLGDSKVNEKAATVYSKPVVVKGEKVKVEKGVAFPTCISVNHVLGNFSPRESDKEVVLAAGDVAKIELGVHIDGYIAVGTHIVVVGGGAPEEKQANAIVAANTAVEAVMRLLKPGNKSTEITRIVRRIGEIYGVKPIEGVKCCNVKRFVLEGAKQVPINHRPEEKPEEFEIEEGEVYTIEVAFTTGDEGKVSDKDGLVTVFRRAVDMNYMLKLKAARQMFSEINTKAPSVAFGLRDLESKLGSVARLGLKEILEHDLLHPYPVLIEKPEHTIATRKCTCLIQTNGVLNLINPSKEVAQSTVKIEDAEVNQLLSTSLKRNKKKKKKAAAKK